MVLAERRPVTEVHKRPQLPNILDSHYPALHQIAGKNKFERGRLFIDSTSINFLESAQKAGVIEKLSQTEEPTKFVQNIIISWFYINTDASGSEIGKLVKIKTRGLPRERFMHFMNKIYNASPEEIKNRFERKDLRFSREETQRRFDKRSEVNGGKRELLRQLAVVEGITDYKQLAQRAGVSQARAVNALVVFRKQKLLFPTQREIGRRVRSKLREDITVEEAAHLLKVAPSNLIFENPDFLSLTTILKNMGVNASSKEVSKIARKLISSRIVTRILTNPNDPNKSRGYYYHIAQMPDISKIINSLEELYIERDAGEMSDPEKIKWAIENAKTSTLRKNPNFSALSTLLRTHGRRFNNRQIGEIAKHINKRGIPCRATRAGQFVHIIQTEQILKAADELEFVKIAE